jgi:hypothetical protein
MHIERTDYASIAIAGLENVVKEKLSRHDFMGVGCHRGERRSVAAIAVLDAIHAPIANSFHVFPTINYEDFLLSRFVVNKNGLSVPGKTDFPFRSLLLFQDGGHEEVEQIRQIKEILSVEAEGALDTFLIAEVRDEEGLMGLA